MSEAEWHAHNFIVKTYKSRRGNVDKNNYKFKRDYEYSSLEYQTYLEACTDDRKYIENEIKNYNNLLSRALKHNTFFDWHKSLFYDLGKKIKSELNQVKTDWDGQLLYDKNGCEIKKYSYDAVAIIEPTQLTYQVLEFDEDIDNDKYMDELVKLYFDIGKHIKNYTDKDTISDVCKVPLDIIVEIVKDFCILYDNKNPKYTYLFTRFNILPQRSETLTPILNNYLLAYNNRWSKYSTKDQLQFNRFLNKIFLKDYQLDIKLPQERNISNLF